MNQYYDTTFNRRNHRDRRRYFLLNQQVQPNSGQAGRRLGYRLTSTCIILRYLTGTPSSVAGLYCQPRAAAITCTS
jgi:hypothetical protein